MLTKLCRCILYRNFSNSLAQRNSEKKPSETSPSTGASGKEHLFSKIPTNFEKKILIYSGKYKTMEEIPKLVMPETLENSRSKIRIKVANLMIVVTLAACGIIIYNGKASRKEKVRKWEEKRFLKEAEKNQNVAVQQN